MKDEKSLRDHIQNLLEGKEAHADFEKVFGDVPAAVRGVVPQGLPHSLWRLLEHIRIAQWDILEFTRNPKHVSPAWPDGHWPTGVAPENDEQWNKSVAAFRADARAMRELVSNPETDLFARIPHGEGQTVLREALLVADHNAYHLGQAVLVRRALGAWE